MKQDRRWLYIAILALVIAVIWVAVSAISKLRQKTVPPDIEKAAEPLNPSLDQTIFTKLSRRGG